MDPPKSLLTAATASGMDSSLPEPFCAVLHWVTATENTAIPALQFLKEVYQVGEVSMCKMMSGIHTFVQVVHQHTFIEHSRYIKAHKRSNIAIVKLLLPHDLRLACVPLSLKNEQ